MKNIFLFLFLTTTLFSSVLISCSSNEKENDESKVEEENDNPIVGKWKLHNLQKKEGTNSEMDLKNQPTEVILSLMDGGYFLIYDTFVDPRFDQKGFNRISETSKGQWEFIDNKKLILHHNSDDSTVIEELDVTMLNKNTLVTKGKDKKSSIYKTYEGY
ncbi:MAG: hypothetical protein V4622_09755 [Bacteroidota bacterium]